jgi:hypothetical protein
VESSQLENRAGDIAGSWADCCESTAYVFYGLRCRTVPPDHTSWERVSCCASVQGLRACGWRGSLVLQDVMRSEPPGCACCMRSAVSCSHALLPAPALSRKRTQPSRRACARHACASAR